MEKPKAGDRIKFVSEGHSYEVCAANDRYAVCIKPFNLYRTTLYTIIDFDRGVRGPDNMVFGGGYLTKKDAEDGLAQLQAGEIEVSHRNCIDLDIEKIIPHRAA